MTGRLSIFLLSGAIGLTLTGCSATSPTMRAQSPSASFASWGGGGVCDNGMGSCDAGGCPSGMYCDSGMCPSGGMCPPGAACSAGGHCPDQCLNLPFHPVHRNFHTYDVPNDLCYPADDTPPAMYQYPYYTTRGPTDFFMK